MNSKVDVAIQSYKKPESLVHSLLSLHDVARDSVDTIWINDDKSSGNELDIYKSKVLTDALYPWKVMVRENTVRMGWWLSFVKGFKPSYLSYPYMIFRMAWNYYKNRSFFVSKDDIRYQWAIDNTDKKYLFVMHDDITFKKNIIKQYLGAIEVLDKPAIVGDLGQCWRCAHHKAGCSSEKVSDGYRPSERWPNTRVSTGDHAWACRINEWSALLSVSSAREILSSHKIFYGNYDNRGDVSAYWFSLAVNNGYTFKDPIPLADRESFYIHWEGGRSGHSVWVDQGNGKSSYDKFSIRKRLKDEFKFDWAWD